MLDKLKHRRAGIGRRWGLTALSIGTAVALLAGCSIGRSASDGSGEPEDGGEITFLINNIDGGWAPSKSAISTYEANIWGQLTDKLVYADAEGKITPWIAESWDENNGGLEYVLHLKEGVTFSDGTPLDAAAVVANIESWAKGAPDRGISRIGLFPSSTYDHSEVVDSKTVKVILTKPTLGFIPTLGYHGSILLSPKSIALSLADQADITKEIGSGPFTVESWREGDNVVLKKRPDYNWGPTVAAHSGPAHLDKITFKVVKEDTLRSSAVQNGQADVAYNVSPQELESLKDEGFTVSTPRYLGFVHGYRVSTQALYFDDVKVRQAVQHGLDRAEILNTVYTEDWQAAESFIQSNVPEAGDHAANFAFAPDRSAQLLDEAGWVKGPDGVRTKDGRTLEVTLFPTPYLNTSQPEAELVAQQLGKIGFKVNLQKLDISSYGDRVDKNPAVALVETTRSFIDVGTVGGVLTSNNGGEDWFKVGSSDQKLNELSAAIAAAPDRVAREKNVEELQQYVLDQGYFIPLEQIVQRVYLQAPSLHGVTFNALAIPNYYDAWTD